MPLPVNEARGEIAVQVDEIDLVVAAEMRNLAQLSSALNCKTLHDLYRRIAGAELFAMFTVLETCVVRGDGKAAADKLSFQGAVALAAAMERAMAHHAGPDLGNAGGARTKSKQRPSPGATG